MKKGAAISLDGEQDRGPNVRGDIVMASRRKSMQVNEHERSLLVKIYLRWRIPVDQYESRPEELEALCEEWRGLCKRTDPDGHIFHYMRNERKCRRWVVFNGDYQPALPIPALSPEETMKLIAIYTEMVAATGEGSDSIAYDGETAKLIAARFAEESGREVPPHQLLAKVTAIRKRGLLPPTQKRDPNEKDDGFTDINEVA